jgi:hypothetical protein
MPYNSLIVYKSILQIEIIVLEVLFLDFVAGKKNIFSRSGYNYNNGLKFVSSRIQVYNSHFHSLFINEWKTQSNCIHDPTFRHSSIVSSSGEVWSRNMAFYIPMGWRYLPIRWKSNRFSRPGHVIYFMFTNVFCKSRLSCAKIEVYHNMQHHIHSLKSACAGSFILEFAARKGNIFSRPACDADQN